MAPLFSIIIPAYNVAPYLRECLDSLLAQTFADWEAICIDDGSSDESGAILDEYALKDARFKVIHKRNEGVSVARNVGLSSLRGEYFTFLDADDILLPNALTLAKGTLESFGCDGLCFNPICVTFRNELDLPQSEFKDVQVNLVDDRMDLLWGENGVYGFSCGRIYRASLFCHLRFPIGMKMCEDAWHWVDALMVPAKWCTISRPMIGYRQVVNSASNTFDAEFNRCILKAFAHTCQSLRAMNYSDGNPMRLFWERNGAIIESHLRLMFRDWKTFSKEDRSDLARRAKEIVGQMGYNPFSWDMRFRIAALGSVAARAILPILGLMCDWLWPRAKRRLIVSL